jgi:hypothetical protein
MELPESLKETFKSVYHKYFRQGHLLPVGFKKKTIKKKSSLLKRNARASDIEINPTQKIDKQQPSQI